VNPNIVLISNTLINLAVILPWCYKELVLVYLLGVLFLASKTILLILILSDFKLEYESPLKTNINSVSLF